jgi:hypothetical protein
LRSTLCGSVRIGCSAVIKRLKMNVVYKTANVTVGTVFMLGTVLVAYNTVGVLGAAASAFLAAMLMSVVAGWLLL